MNLVDPMKEISEKLDFIAIQENHRNLLLDMPKEPMREILGKCDFIAVQSLRKTCHSIRNFVDNQSFGPSFESLEFRFAEDSITLSLEPKKLDDGEIKHTYKENGNHTEITYENNQKSHEKLVKDVNFLDLFCQDFTLLTKNSKTIFSMSFYFQIFGNLAEKIQKILKNFQTEDIFFNVASSSQVVSLLPFFDSNFIKTLCIADFKKSDMTLDLKEIMELEQWKLIENFEIRGFVVRQPQTFKHLKSGSATFTTITMEDLEVLKESFLHSSNFSRMVLKYNYMVDPLQIFEFLSDDYYINEKIFGCGQKRWFFEIPNNPDHVLSVEVNSRSVVFRSLSSDQVPLGAIVKE